MPQIPEDISTILSEIDAELKAEGVLPHQRPMKAVIAFGRRFNISLPLFKLRPTSVRIPEFAGHEHLTAKIYDWFDDVYGDRTKVDPSSNARVAVLAHGDIWEMRLPVIFGDEIVQATRNFEAPENVLSEGPIHTNAASHLEQITAARLRQFSDEDLAEALELYRLGRQVRATFDRFRNHHTLFPIAESSWSAAVMHLTAQNPDHGESRWSSLQLVEKFMKGLLHLIDDVTPEEIRGSGHELKKLHKLLARSIRGINLMPLAKKVQCTAEVRYGETISTRAKAYEAHKSSLKIIASLGSIRIGNEQ